MWPIRVPKRSTERSHDMGGGGKEFRRDFNQSRSFLFISKERRLFQPRALIAGVITATVFTRISKKLWSL